MVVVPVLAVRVTMLDFFLRRGTYIGDSACEFEGLTSERMVAVHNDGVCGDFGNAVEQHVLAIVGFTFEFHTHGNIWHGEAIFRFHPHQFCIVFTESVFGFEHEAECFTDIFTLEFGFYRGENIVVAAMQVADRFLSLLQYFAGAVGELIGDGDHAVFDNLHWEYLKLSPRSRDMGFAGSRRKCYKRLGGYSTAP